MWSSARAAAARSGAVKKVEKGRSKERCVCVCGGDEDGDDPDEDYEVKTARWYRDVTNILRWKTPLL